MDLPNVYEKVNPIFKTGFCFLVVFGLVLSFLIKKYKNKNNTENEMEESLGSPETEEIQRNLFVKFKINYLIVYSLVMRILFDFSL